MMGLIQSDQVSVICLTSPHYYMVFNFMSAAISLIKVQNWVAVLFAHVPQ